MNTLTFIIRRKDGSSELYEVKCNEKTQESIYNAFGDAISKFPGCKVELF